jgi:hypothetical protein
LSFELFFPIRTVFSVWTVFPIMYEWDSRLVVIVDDQGECHWPEEFSQEISDNLWEYRIQKSGGEARKSYV